VVVGARTCPCAPGDGVGSESSGVVAAKCTGDPKRGTTPCLVAVKASGSRLVGGVGGGVIGITTDRSVVFDRELNDCAVTTETTSDLIRREETSAAGSGYFAVIMSHQARLMD
jgi:hypothetical protein